MLYRVGRLLQLTGMILLPVAMAGELSQSLNLKQMLLLAGAGAAIFAAGWWLQQQSSAS